jgi:hypothetical protein
VPQHATGQFQKVQRLRREVVVQHPERRELKERNEAKLGLQVDKRAQAGRYLAILHGFLHNAQLQLLITPARRFELA